MTKNSYRSRQQGSFALSSAVASSSAEASSSAASSSAASSQTASAARITCVFCGIEHNEYTAPGIPALTCDKDSCIDQQTYKRQQEISNFSVESFAWSTSDGQPGWASSSYNQKQMSLFEERRYVHQLRTFASMRGRMVCDICNHTFLPSDSAFLYPELMKYIDKTETPFVCYDCGCISEFADKEN